MLSILPPRIIEAMFMGEISLGMLVRVTMQGEAFSVENWELDGATPLRLRGRSVFSFQIAGADRFLPAGKG